MAALGVPPGGGEPTGLCGRPGNEPRDIVGCVSALRVALDLIAAVGGHEILAEEPYGVPRPASGGSPP